jgi:clan AA aspartic protease
VDTGFSGFLLLPKSMAEPHQLTPVGSTKARLADGSSSVMPVSLVSVGFAGRTCAGSATIAQQDCHPLVGLDFLRIFQLTLVIDNQRLCLLPNGTMSKILYPGPVA